MSDTAPSAPAQNPPAPKPAAPKTSGYTVRTSWRCSAFHVGDTVVTPKGILDEDGNEVAVSKDQADELVAAAKKSRMKLHVQEAGN